MKEENFSQSMKILLTLWEKAKEEAQRDEEVAKEGNR